MQKVLLQIFFGNFEGKNDEVSEKKGGMMNFENKEGGKKRNIVFRNKGGGVRQMLTIDD